MAWTAAPERSQAWLVGFWGERERGKRHTEFPPTDKLCAFVLRSEHVGSVGFLFPPLPTRNVLLIRRVRLWIQLPLSYEEFDHSAT